MANSLKRKPVSGTSGAWMDTGELQESMTSIPTKKMFDTYPLGNGAERVSEDRSIINFIPQDISTIAPGAIQKVIQSARPNQTLAIPLIINTNHFVLVVYHKGKVLYIDPFGNPARDPIARELAGVENSTVTMQTDAVHCGDWVVMTFETLLENIDKPLSASQLAEMTKNKVNTQYGSIENARRILALRDLDQENMNRMSKTYKSIWEDIKTTEKEKETRVDEKQHIIRNEIVEEMKKYLGDEQLYRVLVEQMDNRTTTTTVQVKSTPRMTPPVSTTPTPSTPLGSTPTPGGGTYAAIKTPTGVPAAAPAPENKKQLLDFWNTSRWTSEETAVNKYKISMDKADKDKFFELSTNPPFARTKMLDPNVFAAMINSMDKILTKKDITIEYHDSKDPRAEQDVLENLWIESIKANFNVIGVVDTNSKVIKYQPNKENILNKIQKWPDGEKAKIINAISKLETAPKPEETSSIPKP